MESLRSSVDSIPYYTKVVATNPEMIASARSLSIDGWIVSVSVRKFSVGRGMMLKGWCGHLRETLCRWRDGVGMYEKTLCR